VILGTVILDVDGTLVDSNDAHARAWVDAFAEDGITVSLTEVRRSIGMGGDKLMPAVSRIEEDSARGKRISGRRSEIFMERYFPNVRAFASTRELIEKFRDDGFELVVASSAKEDELEPLLERAGVADLVGPATSSDDAERSKPDPDIVRAAMRKAGADSQRAIMLGDTPYDIEAAGRAAVPIVALECGGWRREDLHGAVAVYADAADLLLNYEESPFARRRDGQHVGA
jgi:phosphoglycolate phosphatase-like HAD superfamily hydrolase